MTRGPALKIVVTDFGLDPSTNLQSSLEHPLIQLLASSFDVQFSNSPDFLVYSVYGKNHYDFDCVKIFYTHERQKPHFGLCDYAFTFEYENHPRHYRLPYYAFFSPENLVQPPEYDPERILREKTGFCSFVVSNGRQPVRNRFFEKLSRYKRVDSGGRYRNNVGGPVADKHEFARRYKFAIAFENRSCSGYTTEKIADAMHADSIPVYWGSPDIGREFNTESFLNYRDFDSEDDLIDRIVELDENDDLYLEMLRQPWLNGNRLDESLTATAIVRQFQHIFSTAIVPRSRSPLYRMRGYAQRSKNRFNDSVRLLKRRLGLRQKKHAA